MALEIGTAEATSGMAQTIYDQMKEVMEPGFQGLSEADLNSIRDGWKRLSFAIAKGIIDHITANMEIFGIQTGNMSTTIPGNTGSVNNHQHGINLTVTQNSIVSTQQNDGTGHVR